MKKKDGLQTRKESKMIMRFAAGMVALVLMSAGALEAAAVKYQRYNFRAYVVKASGQTYREFGKKKKPMLKVRSEEEYSIVVHNPMPVRVGVAVSIDGLNSIDGKRTSPGNARKWIIEANSSITVGGWQISKKKLKKFVFTEDEASYAKWQEDKSGKPLTVNLGVIGVAWFWNADELYRVLHPPKPFADEVTAMAEKGAPSAAPGKKKSRAGTGMGTEKQNLVRQVEFDATAGMFKVKNVLMIFYEFAQDPPEPQPFVDDDEDDIRFAPDMTK